MNFGTIGGFMARNGKNILTKSAIAVCMIAGLAFLTDKPEDEIEELEGMDMKDTTEEFIEAPVVKVTED